MQFYNTFKVGIFFIALLAGLSIFSKSKKPTGSFYEAEYYYVLANSGLPIREKPSPKAAKLYKIPYNTKIKVDKFTGVENTFQGLKNYWAKVTYNGRTGYLFSGFLSRLKGPKYNLRSLKRYAFDTFKQIENTVIKKDAGDHKQQITIFENNISLSITEGFETYGETLFLPGFTYQEAFLIGINLDSRYSKFSYKPDSDQEYFQCFYDPDECIEMGDCLTVATKNSGGIYISIAAGC